MSPCSNEDIPLCEPHPGHRNPVIVKNGQRGKKPEWRASTKKYTGTKTSAAAKVISVLKICSLLSTNNYYISIARKPFLQKEK